MAFDESQAKVLRRALSRTEGITEKKMFGGLCFLLNGNLLCGVHQDGAMARVGKQNESQALMLEGVEPLSFTGRKMGGMVEISFESLNDAKIRRAILLLAREFVGGLPPK